jgi:hypothetical protein
VSVPSEIVEGMTLEDLLTVAAVLIALGSLWFAGVSTRAGQAAARAAERAATASEQQTAIQRELRIDAAQPYVWVDLRPDSQTGQLLTLVVGNSGPTVATDVSVTFDPPLELAAKGTGWAAGEERLRSGIASLPPGRTIAWSGGVAWEAIPEGRPNSYTASVRATGPFGEVPEVRYAIHLNDIRESHGSPPGTLHGVTEAVNRLARLRQ